MTFRGFKKLESNSMSPLQITFTPLIILFLVTALTPVMSQTEHPSFSTKSKTTVNEDSLPHSLCYKINLKEVPADILKVAISPFNWNNQEFRLGMGSLLVTGLTFTIDKEVNDLITKNQNPFLKSLSKDYLRLGGEGYMIAGGLALTFLGSKIGKDEKLAFVTYRAAEAWIIAVGATGLLKLITHRHRPEESLTEPFIFDGPSLSKDHLSFVSGHTSSAFAVATIFSHYYKDRRWVTWTSYTLASLVGFSRIYDSKHWVSDVIGGALLGTWIGYGLAKPNQKNKQGLYSLYPIYSSEIVGLSMIIVF